MKNLQHGQKNHEHQKANDKQGKKKNLNLTSKTKSLLQITPTNR